MNLLCSGILCLIISLCAVGCGGSSVQNRAFSFSDLEGSWKLAGCGYQYRTTSCSSGSLVMGESGAVTGGDLVNFGVDARRFTGGTLEISGKGFVHGIILSYLRDTDLTEEQAVIDGQMTSDKNMVVYAGTAPITEEGIGIILKERGSFSPPDIEGTWLFPLENRIFSVSAGSSGDILDCRFVDLSGNTGTCEGRFSIGGEGSVSGKIKSTSGDTFTMEFSGQMNANKGSMIFAGAISTKFEGAAALGIRKDGDFSSSALQGRWKIFHAAHQKVLHGEIELDAAGAVTGGKWNLVRGGSGTFSQGFFSVSREGSISGFVTTSANDTYTVHDGQIALAGDILAALDKDNSGAPGLLILVNIRD